MSTLEKTQLQLGYIPLLDCIALLWAKQQGFFEEVGLDVTLVKEASWASLRDRLAFGLLDAAHCLSAMLPAAAVGADQIGIALQTPLILSKNRAFISLSQKLIHQLAIKENDNVQTTAQKVTSYIETDHPLSLAHVFKHSIHHYCLREWLALADSKIAQTLKLKALPPPYMVEALDNHVINGFCVGEPWNTQGELLGLSKIVCSSQDIIPNVADKVLAVTQEWAEQHPQTLIALTTAIIKAQKELSDLKDFSPVLKLLVDFGIVRFHCSEEVHVDKYYMIQNIVKHLVKENAAPQPKDFYWLFEQMQKWDELQIDQAQITSLGAQCINLEAYEQAKQRYSS
ncbi:ABC transporter substrate-binding protein [Acinetobacter seifertii]|uniref:ABC transporter substrate-binding protein n=1 Tax=Acinetobacter seifertii TaxID=1530123 RepID=A0A7H2T4C8_9GAMM|nr:ABC transporter substrate-binding protein [Acinetobacter seifertii]QNX13748.1 ABC transporter substrate-binding protein [Acinetobacter seifertii]QNX18286.1 ABC transporter substrate-binding protein [Acinetobacter seifertii]QNX24960.1 ABC transporter substrate-binding protein [Acinetobacter seifertii]QNX35919.1 ABC transporter substrate-binding protein [Acinetobacter seifertii]QNX39793.1 ABC transporter substrate-binding protein [Acinetobacter seifertii]